MKSPQLLALENTLDILGQQRDHAIFILESRIEENDATASLFAVHRNFLRDQEDFLRAQIKALKESENHLDTFPPSPPIAPQNHPEHPADPPPPQESPAPNSPSRFAQALAILLLFFFPTITSANSSTTARPIATSLLHSPVIHLQKSPATLAFPNPQQPPDPPGSLSLATPFFFTNLSPFPYIHPHPG